jgi:adrenodoxin-NADP+ reductase
MRVCIVGSGPAGLYTAHRLLKSNPSIKIDILESLPFPFGLLRYGVAPDHPQLQPLQQTFHQILSKTRFYGNIELGFFIAG